MRKSDVSKSGDLDLHEFVTYLTEHEKQLKIGIIFHIVQQCFLTWGKLPFWGNLICNSKKGNLKKIWQISMIEFFPKNS